ncbi:MAG: insulinase family protein [Chloroflexi bacterium]|nr:insulinase family protein [Chloroflexota bacterium]
MIYSLPITPQRIVRRQFANGLTVVLCENQASASVALEGDILAGGYFEQPGQDGLANLTASLLRRGTQEHSFQALNQLLDDVGASLSASADDLHVNISGQVLADDLPLLLKLLAEMLTEPAFDDTEFTKNRGQVLTNLGIYQNNTGYRAARAFSEALYPAGHPYARSSFGTLPSVASLENKDIRCFYKTYYHPGTCILVICGAVHVQQLLGELERLFGGWLVTTPLPSANVPMVATPAGITRAEVPLPDKSQVDLMWGAIGVSRLDPDYYAARMADVVLGRLGLMGRLGSRIRDELGLAYYASSHLESGIGPVPWFISAGVNPASIGRAIEELRSLVRGMREQPISDEELDDCRSFLIGSMPIELETNVDIAEQILSIEKFQLGYDYLLRYPDVINHVTKDDIRRVVYEHLDPDRYVLALSGTF